MGQELHNRDIPREDIALIGDYGNVSWNSDYPTKIAYLYAGASYVPDRRVADLTQWSRDDAVLVENASSTMREWCVKHSGTRTQLFRCSDRAIPREIDHAASELRDRGATDANKIALIGDWDNRTAQILLMELNESEERNHSERAALSEYSDSINTSTVCLLSSEGKVSVIECQNSGRQLGVETVGSTHMASRSVVLRGNITGLGESNWVSMRFFYWVAGKQDTTLRSTDAEKLASIGIFTTTVTGLQPNSTYVFHARVDTANGTTSWGGNLRFSTDNGTG
ncbi:hypothetical protein GCM10027355_36740 [Haloplanus salinarum]